MQKLSIKHSVLTSGLLLSALVLTPMAVNVNAAPARAQEAQTSPEQQRIEAQERRDEAKTKSEERKATNEAKLENNKLKGCQNREKAINNIMARISDRGTKQIDVFNKISERTQTFYTDKGRILSNYEELIADVAAKQAGAEAAVAAVKESSVSFECDGTDPKGAAASFKESLKTQNEALKEYKTSIKNLIVGVKSVQSTENSEAEQNQEGNQ